MALPLRVPALHLFQQVLHHLRELGGYLVASFTFLRIHIQFGRVLHQLFQLFRCQRCHLALAFCKVAAVHQLDLGKQLRQLGLELAPIVNFLWRGVIHLSAIGLPLRVLRIIWLRGIVVSDAFTWHHRLNEHLDQPLDILRILVILTASRFLVIIVV